MDVRFTSVRFREGYEPEQVDQFLERVDACLRARAAGLTPAEPLTVQQVQRVRFSATKFRFGYDQTQVDNYLDEVIEQLRRL